MEATVREMKMGDLLTFRFHPVEGILEIRLREQAIQAIVEKAGGLPARELVIPGKYLGVPERFQNVTEVRSLYSGGKKT